MRIVTVVMIVAAVVTLAAAAQATPMNPKQVSADAQWVVHMDVDAMKASSVVQKAYAKHLETHPGAEQHLDMLSKVIGMNPTKDLFAVTMYGTQLKPHTGVMMIQAKVDHEPLLAKVKIAPDYRESTYGKHTLYTWTHAKGSKHEHSVTGAFRKPNILIVGHLASDVMAALDVLDGKIPSLGGSKSPLAAKVPAGTILLGRAVGLKHAKVPCKSPLVKQSEAMCLAMGENDGTSFLAAKLTTTSSETAEQIKTILEGLRAMGALHKADDPDAMKVLGAFHVEAEGNSVTISMELPAEEVWGMCQKAHEKMGKKDWKKHWMMMHKHHP